MSCCCAEHAKRLQQQVLVMRNELKNMRQRADGSIHSHRKQMSTLKSMLTNVSQQPQIKCGEQRLGPVTDHEVSLEKGCINTVPIGYINSCFAFKNGTPRQPTVCGPSRATLQIQHSVFTNPDHPLIGLEQYSHVWIIFLFHKNGHLNYKAKVRPPRLNGQRVGVYSTRSPHRPNALGLTLAKLEHVEGDTLHLSGIDMISGTPVLDIKPYIPDYDCPHSRKEGGMEQWDVSEQQIDCQETNTSGPNLAKMLHASGPNSSSKCQVIESSMKTSFSPVDVALSEVRAYLQQGELSTASALTEAEQSEGVPLTGSQGELADRVLFGEESYSTIAAWIRQPPVSTLEVRFTPSAEKDLKQFEATGSTELAQTGFKFLKDPDEAVAAIKAVLSADPRSVYRRTRCHDRLFFFTIDTADVTCWFGEGFAEVLRVQPLKCKT